MRSVKSIPEKIITPDRLMQQMQQWKLLNKKVVFTNGVFDLLHEGHIFSLCEAASMGHMLIVAINSDASVRRLKGQNRPVNSQYSRALVLASLLMTDAVVVFEEDTPLQLITTLLPDVLVKGGDYTIEQIAGAKEVIANGGEVKIAPIVKGFSTTATIERMKAMSRNDE